MQVATMMRSARWQSPVSQVVDGRASERSRCRVPRSAPQPMKCALKEGERILIKSELEKRAAQSRSKLEYR